MSWQLARRAERLNPSTIREILKITERPGIVSLAGGLPSADTFPVEAMRVATERVLREQPRAGRAFTAENEVEGRHRVAVLSHGLWQRRFGADPATASTIFLTMVTDSMSFFALPFPGSSSTAFR